MSKISTAQLPKRGNYPTLSKTFTTGTESFTFTVNYDPKTNRVVHLWSIEVRFQNGTRTHMQPEGYNTALIRQLNWKEAYLKAQQHGEEECIMAQYASECRQGYAAYYESMVGA